MAEHDDQDGELHSNTLTDVKQLGLVAAIGSLGYVFWIVGGMEMVERLAYYGVRSLSTLYAKAPVSEGGLGITLSDLGIIFTVWAFVQTFVPVFTGGLSDRYGYKETIFASTILKILGYLVMAWYSSFWGFFAGAVVLAFGTGIFKPGIQGTLAKVTTRRNSSVAWGIFYQTVNIGAFIGPLVGAQLRQVEWAHVFYFNAAIISLNFLLLLAYKEPDKDERLVRRAKVRAGTITEKSLWRESVKELKNPVLAYYILIFSGFWFMLYSFWDVLPAHFDDWVDTSVIVSDLFGADGTRNPIAIFAFGMDKSGTFINPEGLVNLNAFMIMTICFVVAGFSAKLKATSSLALGTFLSAAALTMIGGFHWAWAAAAAIMIFSLGEMLSSPKFSEYLANIAPSDKKAMFLGFSQLPIGIGWTLEGYFGPRMYDLWASKERFSREMLSELGMATEQISGIPQGESFDVLVEFSGRTAADLTSHLYATHDIGMVWYVMGIVGVLTSFGLIQYGRWTYRVAREAKLVPAQ